MPMGNMMIGIVDHLHVEMMMMTAVAAVIASVLDYSPQYPSNVCVCLQLISFVNVNDAVEDAVILAQNRSIAHAIFEHFAAYVALFLVLVKSSRIV